MAPSRSALIAAHQSQTMQVRERLTDYAKTLWGGLGSWRDEDVDRFVNLMAPRVLAGRAKVAQLTDAYLSQMLKTTMAGAVDTSNLRGAPVSDVYRRPASTMYDKLSKGQPIGDAIAASTARLANLVATDLQMAMVQQASASLDGNGFRRVLNGPGDCALCVIASTQRYHSGDLLPIHPGCNCTVAPLGPGEGVDQVIDPELLEQVHAQVKSLTGDVDRGGRSIDYRKLIIVREHGEIGPLLSWKNHKFTKLDQGHAVKVADTEPYDEAPAKVSWLYDSIKDENLAEYDSLDLRELYNEAVDAGDDEAVRVTSAELARRDKQAAGYRGTGYTRAELRTQYAEYVDRSYWKAEAATNGQLLNAAGRREGIDPKTLFTGTESRAMKYASDDLKYHWQTAPRLSFDAFTGDEDAIGRAGKVDF